MTFQTTAAHPANESESTHSVGVAFAVSFDVYDDDLIFSFGYYSGNY